MSKPKYPWPLSLVMTPHVFTDGTELWPSGREQFSYLSPDKRRVNIVVANPPTPEGGREYVVFTNTISKYTDGCEITPEAKAEIIKSFKEYFSSTKRRYRFEA